MDVFRKIAEQKIQQALREGQFDNLPGKGRPLALEDLSGVPEELRLGYKILRNAGVLPAEMQIRREIHSLQQLLDSCLDEEERRQLKRRLNARQLRFNVMMERRQQRCSPRLQHYYRAISRKLG